MTTEGRKIAGLPVDAFVKGGTTSQRWDNDKKKFYAETEKRRAHQDAQRQLVEGSAGRPNMMSSLVSMQLSGQGNPKVCLTYKAHDTALEQQALCEVAITGPEQMLLSLVCPKCLERTGKMHDSQVIVRSEHRKFHLDVSKKGVWVDPGSGLSYPLAGTITADDLLTCSALGCGWKFRIDDSNLYGSHQFNM